MSIPTEAVLESSRLTLEPLLVRHADALYEPLSDSELYRFIPRDPPRSLESLKQRFEVLQRRASPDGSETWLNWAARDRSLNSYIGTIEATVFDDHTAHLAYTTFRAYWNSGYAKEGCTRVCRFLFEECGVARITLEMDSRNVASIRLDRPPKNLAT